MKILKRTNGQGIIFDTENIESSTPSTLRPGIEDALHQNHRTTDLQFLAQFFPDGHPIYILFGSSYFYIVTGV